MIQSCQKDLGKDQHSYAHSLGQVSRTWLLIRTKVINNNGSCITTYCMINCALHITIVLSQYMSKFENKTLLLLRKTVVQYDRCPDKKGRLRINTHEGLCEVMKDSSI